MLFCPIVSKCKQAIWLYRYIFITRERILICSTFGPTGLGEKFSSPPGAPTEFLGPDKAQLDQKGGYKWHIFGARKASKSIQKTESFTSGAYT